MPTYAEKLKDPRWQKKRLEILERDRFTCMICGDTKSTLHVHHFRYSKNPWETESEDLKTYCEDCHDGIEFLKKEMCALLIEAPFRNLLCRIVMLWRQRGEIPINLISAAVEKIWETPEE